MRTAFTCLLLLISALLVFPAGCVDASIEPNTCPDAGEAEDAASVADAALQDGSMAPADATDALDATAALDAQDGPLDGSAMDANVVDANDVDANHGDAGEVDAASLHSNDTCDDACGEEQACMRQGLTYVCIDCFPRGYSAPTRAPTYVTLTTAAQATALRRYRSLQSVVVPDGPEIPDILENLVCLDWVSGLTVGQTNDINGLRNLQGAQVLELSISPLTRSPSEIPPTLEGLRSLQSVYQSLRISGSSVVTSLHGLEALETVGDLTLMLSGITTLAPLTSLTTITGTFTVPSFLASIDAPALQQVGGLVAASSTLTSLQGLPPVVGSYANLVLDTPSLSSTVQLAGLRRVTGSVLLAWSVPLDGLQELTYVGGSVTLGQVCRPFQAPTGLRAIGGDLMIPAFFWPPRGGVTCITAGETLDDLSELRSVGGTLILSGSGFESLDGLNQLQHVGGLGLYSNPFLTRIDALRNVSGVVPRDIRVHENDRLTSLDGLEGVTDIAGNLLVNYNAALTNLDGLAALTSLGGMYSVGSNPLLPSCEADGVAQRIAASCLCESPSLVPCACNSDCLCGGNDDTATCGP